MGLTQDQYTFLVDGIRPSRVQQLRGNSHLEQWDIRRHLIRCFGFGGFDIETKSISCVSQIEHEQANAKSRWSVVYTAEVRLTIKTNGKVFAVYEDGASGDSQNQPSLGDAHDQALKTALSQALKRCAVNLGDQFGLSLYNGGKADPVVNRSLVVPEGVDRKPAPEDAPVEPEQPAAPMINEKQKRHMHALFGELGLSNDRDKRLALAAEILGLSELTSSNDLTESQAQHVIDGLTTRKRGGR